MPDHPYSRFLVRRIARRRILALAGSAGAASLLFACNSGGGSSKEDSGGDSVAAADRPAGWSDATHGKQAGPNYDVVFPTANVNKIVMTITAENWQAMLDDATVLLGARGTGGGVGGFGGDNRPQGFPGGGGANPPQGGPDGGGPPQGMPGGGPPQGMPGGGGDFTSVNPMWVPGTIEFNGKVWTNVGIRFKGNSSLQSSWRSGTDKMPFKLDFDEFEERFPEIDGQRFHGFKQLSLSNNFGDDSFMRETIAYDLFESAGLAAAQTATYEVTLDRGEGPKTLGLYTFIEVIDDTVLSRFFKDDGGNIYEADGQAASFAPGTNGQIKASFQAEGGDDPDWSDVTALYDALHASTRTTNAAAWRAGLEKVFDVESFLKFLGIAATIEHWDTYGAMTHNYYLYNNPETSKLTWISWDHNFVLGASAGGGGVAPQGGLQGGGRMGGRGTASFDKKEVTTAWPLIRYVFDQPEYVARYNAFLKEFVRDSFDAPKLIAKSAQLAASIKPFVSTDTTEAAYDQAVAALNTAFTTRAAAANAYLATV